MMKLVVLLVLVGISAAAIVSKQRAVIPHYSYHGHGHGVSSRYFDKVEGPAYHGYGYGVGHGYGYYPGYAGYGIGYGAGLGYGYGLGYGGNGLGYGWSFPGVYTSVGL